MATADEWIRTYRRFWGGRSIALPPSSRRAGSERAADRPQSQPDHPRPARAGLRRLDRSRPLAKQWWGPGPVTCPEAHIDLREGGAYRLANLEVDGSITWISGRFERVRVPEELVYTWSVSIVPGEPTLVRVVFLTHPQGTELVLTHERFAVAAVRDMHVEGWGLVASTSSLRCSPDRPLSWRKPGSTACRTRPGGRSAVVERGAAHFRLAPDWFANRNRLDSFHKSEKLSSKFHSRRTQSMPDDHAFRLRPACSPPLIFRASDAGAGRHRLHSSSSSSPSGWSSFSPSG